MRTCHEKQIPADLTCKKRPTYVTERDLYMSKETNTNENMSWETNTRGLVMWKETYLCDRKRPIHMKRDLHIWEHVMGNKYPRTWLRSIRLYMVGTVWCDLPPYLSVYMYAYVYVHVCICVCTYVYVYMYVYMYIFIYVYMYRCIDVCMYVYTYTYMVSIIWSPVSI